MFNSLDVEQIEFVGRKDSKWKDNTIRIIITKNHGNLFVGKDIAEILEFNDSNGNPDITQMTRYMNDNEYIKINVKKIPAITAGIFSNLTKTNPNVTLITENALNKTIIRSDREEAEEFKDFISNILIKIRKEYNLESTFDLMENHSKQEEILNDITFISKDAKARQYTIHKNLLQNLLNPKRSVFIAANMEANIKIMELFDNSIYKKKSQMNENELAARERLMPLIATHKALVENLRILNDKCKIETIKLRSIEPLMDGKESITIDEEIHKSADLVKHLSLMIEKLQKDISYYQSRLIQAIKDISIDIEEKQLNKYIKRADKNIIDIDFYRKEKLSSGLKINIGTIKYDGILKHLSR